MKISRLEIRNFRQHRNIDLDLSGQEGSFVVMRGLNGAGKTNLLKAITWCVTGDLGRSEPKHNPASLVSHGAITETAVGERLSVTVQLEVDFGGDVRADVTRAAHFVKSSEGLVIQSSALGVNVHEPNRGWQKEGEPDLWLDRHLPRRFSHYFFFDGEQLEKFFKETEAKYVRDAVLEIAQIDNLERMVDRLQQTAGDLTKAVAHQKSGESGGELELRYKDLEKREADLKLAIDQKLAVKSENEAALDEARARLGDISAIQSELKRLQTLESLANAAHERATQASNDFYSWTVTVGPYMMMLDAVRSLEAEIDSARERKVLPPAYNPDSLRELINAGLCVCGAEVKQGTPGHTHIEELIAEFSTLSEVGEVLQSVDVSLSRLKGRFFDQLRNADGLGKVRNTSAKEAIEADKRYEALKKQLGEHDDKNIAMTSQHFERAMENAKSIERDLARLERDLEDTRRERVKVQTEIELAASKDEKVQSKLHQLAFTRKVASTAEDLFVALKDEVRENVAQNLDKEFQSMIWKKKAFEPVRIDEEYRVQVINRRGFESRDGLSAGETACLAFAFALTLNNVAGIKYPMVVDSPLGRLSGDVKQSVAKVLSNYFVANQGEEAAQLIMLVTDEEFDENVGRVLEERNPLVLDIAFDQETGEAQIIKERHG